MFISHRLTQLLRGEVPASDKGGHVTVSGQPFLVDGDVAEAVSAYLSTYFRNLPAVLIADENTYTLGGEELEKRLSQLQTLVLNQPEATLSTAKQLTRAVQDAGILIAIGSGTLNDLCKYAAAKLDIPYIIIASAPSMNGYVSPTSSLEKDGIKTSRATKAPDAVFMDMAVMASAPDRLIRSGFGDSICRTTAQADWLLSHLVQNTPYSDLPFWLLQEIEPELIHNASLLMLKDKRALQLLCETLLLSGYGMQIAEGSYPASQGEHILAHYMDQHDPAAVFHGEAIAVTALTMSEIQRRLLGTLPNEVQTRLLPVMLETHVIENAIKAVGLATHPKALGWNETTYRRAIREAYKLRERYGFLNLLAQAQNQAASN